MRSKRRRIHRSNDLGARFLVTLAIVMGLFWPNSAHTAITPAGTPVQSQSQAQYFVGPDQLVSPSNTATTIVSAVYDLQLAPPGDVNSPAFTVQGNEGDTLVTDFTIANAGNAPDSAVVSNAILPASTIGVDAVIVFNDANLNGRFDPGEDDPAFLGLPMGSTVSMSVAIVLATGQGSGTTYVEMQVTSFNDPGSGAETSVVEAINLGPGAPTLHLGPYTNAQALPGGEGSSDDETTATVGYVENFVEFRNDVANLGVSADLVEVTVADTTGWPAGLTVTFRDTTGPPSPSPGSGFFVGALGAGETMTLVTTVSSAGPPLSSFFTDTLSLVLEARSLLDTLRLNLTTDHVIAPPPVQPAGILGLSQTFRENVAGFGDVVTLVVTVSNQSTTAPVTNVLVQESVQPNLNFLSGPSFAGSNGQLSWSVGTLMPGEKREAAIKFIVNSRTSRGNTKAVGHASADVPGNQVAAAGPEVNVLRIRNDIFGDEGIVLGSVFVDDNENDVRDKGERGVGGVAVYLESGEYAMTDSLGKFSIERAFSGYRVVRMDESTLPPGIRWPGDIPDSTGNRLTSERIVHLVPGGHATVHFAVRAVPEPPTTATRSIVAHSLVNVTKRSRVVYQIPSVSNSHFEPGKVFLKTTTMPSLEPIVKYLVRHPDMVVFLEGHTDSIPINTPAFPSNYELGLARASAVKRYLTANGIPESQVIVVSYGDSRPVATNATREGRAKNRRVEIGFIPAHMRDEDITSIERVQTELQHLNEQPDSCDLLVRWDFTTNSNHVFDVGIKLSVPKALDDVDVTVRSDDLDFGGEGGHYSVSGFRRSAGITCEISARVAERDTASIRDLQATIDFAMGDAENAGEDTTYAVVMQPSASKGTLRDFEMVAAWQETIRPRPNRPEPPVVSDTDVHPGIVAPADGAVISRMDQVAVSVCVALGAATELRVNGELVSERQIGQRVVRIADKMEDITYYALKLVPGWNDVVLHSTGLDGTVLADSIAVALAGRPTSLTALTRRVLLPADGYSSTTIRFAIKDQLGFDVVDGVVATVTEGETLLLGADARPDMPGFQVTSGNGYFSLLVRSAKDNMRRTIAVEIDGLRASCDVAWVPPRRPAFMSGLAEVRLGIFAKSGDANPVGLDNFEDGMTFGGDARLFLQGTGYAGINLTARMDTRKREDDPVFKSINPDRQYTIYGDASEIRYAAPANRGNYISLEKDESFVRYGDFESPLTEGEFLRYQRSATGVSGRLVSGDHGVKGFATKTDFATKQDEIPGDGTTGFYYLSSRPVVENTLNIEIQVRDRFRPEKVIEVRPLSLNRDYTVNYFNGAVLFKEPVPVTTFDLDPVMIVARYEIQTDSEAAHLFGIRGDLVDKGRFRVGSSAVGRGKGEIEYALYGLDGSVNLGPLGLSGEFAQSHDDVTGDGNAWKVGARLSNQITDTAVYLRQVDGNFQNPSFAGSTHELYAHKVGFDSRVHLSREMSIDAEGFYHEFDQTDERKSNLAGVARYENDSFSMSAGVRATGHDLSGDSRDALLSLAGIGFHKPGVAEFGTHWEYNLGDETVEDYPNRLRSTLGVPITGRAKFVLSHEYLSAHERDDTHQLLAGFEAQATEYTTAFSKYSMNRTGANERMGAVSGIKQKLPLGKNLAGSLDLEGFRSFSNANDEEYVAFKSGLNWRRLGLAFAEGQYEYRWQRKADRHVFRLNAARQWDNGLALLLRDAISFTKPTVGDDALSFDGRIAGAFRPEASRVWTLLLLKSLYDRRSPVDPEAITWRLVFSTDINFVPASMHEIRTKFAIKYVENYSEGFAAETMNYLALLQYVYRFRRAWDIDLWGRYIAQNGDGTNQLGTGVELGRLFFNRVRVGAGYSLNGFEEKDMAERDAWANGFGVRVQLLLTDWIFNEIGRE